MQQVVFFWEFENETKNRFGFYYSSLRMVRTQQRKETVRIRNGELALFLNAETELIVVDRKYRKQRGPLPKLLLLFFKRPTFAIRLNGMFVRCFAKPENEPLDAKI